MNNRIKIIISLPAVLATILLSAASITPMIIVAYGQNDGGISDACLTNPSICGLEGTIERPQEFSQLMEEAMEDVTRERTAELFGGEENVPTVGEFMEGVEEEAEFDDEQQAAEFEENGIEINEETGDPISPEAGLRYYDTEPKTTLFNSIFSKILNNATTAAPEIEVDEVQIDVDEGEEEDSAERQTIYYEFDPENPDDDIRIYTTPDQTVQSLSNLLTANINFVRVDLYEDSRAVIYCNGESEFDEADDIRIYAPHTYTPANGYRFENGEIYDDKLNMSIHSQRSPPLDVFTSPEAQASQC